MPPSWSFLWNMSTSWYTVLTTYSKGQGVNGFLHHYIFNSVYWFSPHYLPFSLSADVWHPLPAGWQTCWLIHSCSFINDSWPREFQKKTTGRREREHERCSVCESEEACSTAAVPVTPVVRLNTPIQSISLHSSFAILPFTQWKQRGGRDGERDAAIERASTAAENWGDGGGGRAEEERESVSVLPEKNEELQRERESEGREEGALLFDWNTHSLSHWQGVCSASSHSVCLTYAHTAVALQKHAVKSSSITGTTHGISAALISSLRTDNNIKEQGGQLHRYDRRHTCARQATDISDFLLSYLCQATQKTS